MKYIFYRIRDGKNKDILREMNTIHYIFSAAGTKQNWHYNEKICQC